MVDDEMIDDEWKTVKYKNLPIITSDIPPNPISRLYLMDMNHIEIAYCDCINYDRNGNPRCSVHKGKLQEFYAKEEILYVKHKYDFEDRPVFGKNHIHDKSSTTKKPLCSINILEDNSWKTRVDYITCKNCLKIEFVNRNKEIERFAKTNQFTIGELDTKAFYAKGKIKELK